MSRDVLGNYTLIARALRDSMFLTCTDSALPADSLIRREFEPQLWQKRSECTLELELLALSRLQFDQLRLEHAALSKSSRTPSDELVADAKRHQLSTEDLLRLPVVLDGTRTPPLGFESEEQLRQVLRQVEALAQSLRQLLAPAVGLIFPQSQNQSSCATSLAPVLCERGPAPETASCDSQQVQVQVQAEDASSVERILADLGLPSFVALEANVPGANSSLQDAHLEQLVPDAAASQTNVPPEHEPEFKPELEHEREPDADADAEQCGPNDTASEALDGRSGPNPNATLDDGDGVDAVHEAAPLTLSSMPIAQDEAKSHEVEAQSYTKSSGEPESEVADSDSEEEFELLKLEDACLPPNATDESEDAKDSCSASAATELGSSAADMQLSVASQTASAFPDPSILGHPNPMGAAAPASGPGSLTSMPLESRLAASGTVQLTATLISSTDAHGIALQGVKYGSI